MCVCVSDTQCVTVKFSRRPNNFPGHRALKESDAVTKPAKICFGQVFFPSCNTSKMQKQKCAQCGRFTQNLLTECLEAALAWLKSQSWALHRQRTGLVELVKDDLPVRTKRSSGYRILKRPRFLRFLRDIDSTSGKPSSMSKDPALYVFHQLFPQMPISTLCQRSPIHVSTYLILSLYNSHKPLNSMTTTHFMPAIEWCPLFQSR